MAVKSEFDRCKSKLERGLDRMLYSVEDWEAVEKHQNYVPILKLSRLYARQVDLVECASPSSSGMCEMA
jgi:hypothetical protein